MRTKRSQEAYLLIDHRNSPGISQEFIHANHLDAPAVGAGQVFESAMAVCGHCGADVVLNPNRTRERGWCWSCDKYLCDGCTTLRTVSGVPCKPMAQQLDEIYTRLTKNFV